MKLLSLPFLFFLFSGQAFALPHHHLDISLAPAAKSITVTDRISSLKGRKIPFRMHKNLELRVLSTGDQIQPLSTPPNVRYRDYELHLGPENDEVTLQYSGVIYDPVVDQNSSGLISPEGAVLFGSSHWVPDFFMTFTYEIGQEQMPSGWKRASPTSHLNIPQQEAFLIAGPFHEYTFKKDSSGIPLKVFLRKPEPELAQKFLNLLPSYLEHFQQSWGPYPYSSFAVVENFWETGFGMPAFTLLGSGVLRLPYILNSSVPHELLHNWWGNSVYVDHERGNWCEGLTTYLADHWQQEVLNAGRDYRLQSLMNFQDYTKAAPDFPLREFKQRFNLRSQAIGYGKGMMFFHMLNKRLGELSFNQALRRLYQTSLGLAISYEEIQKTFEEVSGIDLKNHFKQWLDRTGAPRIELSKVELALTPAPNPSASSFKVRFELHQKSPELYELFIPLRFTLADGTVRDETVRLSEARHAFEFTFPLSPRLFEVDPEVDVFRDLDPRERPWGFSNVFGTRDLWLLGRNESHKKAYLEAWQKTLETRIHLGNDELLKNLPSEGSVVLLGDSPEYESLLVQALQGQDFQVSAESVILLGASFAKKDFKTAIVARSKKHPKLILAWIRGEGIETLAPRLLHFGKYGILVFGEKGLALKATWPLLESPLKVMFPERYSLSGTN